MLEKDPRILICGKYPGDANAAEIGTTLQENVSRRVLYDLETASLDPKHRDKEGVVRWILERNSLTSLVTTGSYLSFLSIPQRSDTATVKFLRFSAKLQGRSPSTQMAAGFSQQKYKIGQLYMISKHSHEQSDRGEGVEVVQNEPFEDPHHGNGQFTEKRVYLN
ncbi:hypothetical protein STEG23_016505, partial [Scotinomys teguina]